MKKVISVFTFITLTALLLGFSLSDNKPGDRSLSNNIPVNIKSVSIVKGPEQTVFSSALSESFETLPFPPAGWTKINVAPGATGWYRLIAGTSPVPGFNGGSIICPPGGGSYVAFCNYITGGTNSNDQWLITSQLTNTQPNDSLRFWLRKFGNYLDRFQVRISTTTPTVPAMTDTVATLTFAAADSGYIFYQYNIGSVVPTGSNIYIGFRQWVANAALDGASFCLDLVNVTGVVGITHNGTEVPNIYSLSQNYPNPFNPSTSINFGIPKSGHVKLAVYDILGNEVSVLLDAFENAGNYTASFDASNLASGVYFYKLSSGAFSQTKKMSFVK